MKKLHNLAFLPLLLCLNAGAMERAPEPFSKNYDHVYTSIDEVVTDITDMESNMELLANTQTLHDQEQPTNNHRSMDVSTTIPMQILPSNPNLPIHLELTDDMAKVIEQHLEIANNRNTFVCFLKNHGFDDANLYSEQNFNITLKLIEKGLRLKLELVLDYCFNYFVEALALGFGSPNKTPIGLLLISLINNEPSLISLIIYKVIKLVDNKELSSTVLAKQICEHIIIPSMLYYISTPLLREHAITLIMGLVFKLTQANLLDCLKMFEKVFINAEANILEFYKTCINQLQEPTHVTEYRFDPLHGIILPVTKINANVIPTQKSEQSKNKRKDYKDNNESESEDPDSPFKKY